MGYFTVIARRGGKIELLTGDAAEDVELNDGDKNIGEFHAENEPEARRQLATMNPALDMETMRIKVDADADAALAEQKAEFLEKVRSEAIDAIELPDDTGSPEEMEEVDEEVEETDPDTGEKVKKTKKVKRAKKAKKEKPAKKASKRS